MKKILCFCLACLMLFGLVACNTNKSTEHLYTTHGIYFNIDGQNLLITPSGRPYIFTTNEKMAYSDGDKIQFTYEEAEETYPMTITAKHIKTFEDDFKLNYVANTMKSLQDDYKFNFSKDIYISILRAVEPKEESNVDESTSTEQSEVETNEQESKDDNKGVNSDN